MKNEPNSNLIVELFVANKRGVATDFDGDKQRNEWVKVDLPISDSELIKSVRVYPYANQSEGYIETREDNNALVISSSDVDALVGNVMELFDALFTDKDQKEAFRKLVIRRIWDWYNLRGQGLLDSYRVVE